jgi:two-component system LytT family response regulator
MKPNYRCLLIDDDTFSRETLEDIIGCIPSLQIVKSIGESGMAIKHIVTLLPDIVFLDIDMPEKSGIVIQEEIIELGLETKVIFTTSHEKYVVEAFKNRAFDYLVKPIKQEELIDTLKRLSQTDQTTSQQASSKNKNDEEIIIKNAYGTIILHTNDVFYIEADGSYSLIYLTNGKTETISRNLGKLEGLFPMPAFFNISRSAIINLNYLSKTDRIKKTITLMHGNVSTQLKVSRERFYDLELLISER